MCHSEGGFVLRVILREGLLLHVILKDSLMLHVPYSGRVYYCMCHIEGEFIVAGFTPKDGLLLQET